MVFVSQKEGAKIMGIDSGGGDVKGRREKQSDQIKCIRKQYQKCEYRSGNASRKESNEKNRNRED